MGGRDGGVVRKLVVVALTSALIVGLAGGQPASAAETDSAPSPSGATQEVDLQAIVTAAQDEAVSSGVSVEVDALTTPTEQTRAMPDGTLQYEVSNAPVRAKEDGRWVPVDTDLEHEGGWLVPEATVAPVRFTAGGTDVLAEVKTPSGEWITEVWPHGELPTPTLDGATATYREVLPGVDLKLTATEIGMTSVYVVKSAKAAKSHELRTLGVDIEGATLSKTKTGGVRADGPGKADAVSSPPLWWDASNGGNAEGPGGDDPLVPVVHNVSADRVAMDVTATVASEDVTYPLYIDPDWSTGQSASWYTDAKYPNNSYLSTGAGYILRVGADAGGGWYSNAFFQFPISALRGKQILGATMNTTQIKALFCSPSSIEVRAYGPQNPGFSWNGTAGGWGPVLHNQNPGTCGSPAMAVGWNVTGGVQSHVGANMDIVQFAITYPGGSNTSRRHYDWAASLVVNYNTPPNTPTDLKFVTPAASCGTAAAPTILAGTDVTVSFQQTDPDPGNIDTNVYLYKTSDLANPWQGRNPGLGAQGLKSVTFNGLADGQAYAWRARGSDWKIDGTSFSAWCYFTIDNTGPAVPGFTAPTTQATVGTASTVSFNTALADRVAYIAYTVAPAASSSSFVFTRYGAAPPCGSVQGAVRIVCPNASGIATATVVPTDGSSTVLAIPYDVAGNPGVIPGTPAGKAGTVGASFPLTASNSPAVSFDAGHVWRTQEQSTPLDSTIPDTNMTSQIALTLGADTLRTLTANPIAPTVPLSKPVLGFADPSTIVPALTGPTRTTSAAPVVNPTASFTVAGWAKPGTSGATTVVGTDSAAAGFELGATPTQWQFCLRASATATPVCAAAPRIANADWTHLAGVWDAANGQIRLYLRGSLAASASFGWPGGTSTALLPVDIGATVNNGTVTSRWAGQIADPAVFAGVATAAQLDTLGSGNDPITG